MWTPFLDLRSKFLDLGSKFGLSQVHRQAEESSIYQFKLFEDSSLVFRRRPDRIVGPRGEMVGA
jgi:hypothetical protein